MSNHNPLKHHRTISFGARLFSLILLASFLSSCGTVLQTPLPIATQQLNLVSHTLTEVFIQPPTLTSTSTSTPEPTITQTPEPTSTPTQELVVPDAPKNADPEKWREAYINGFQTGGYIGLKIEAGLAVPTWDPKMETIIWTLGKDKFGYNSEFKFTGEVVPDIYTDKWIVRKRLIQPSGYANSIREFYSLHVKNSQKLVMGIECLREEELDATRCAIVGQVVGQLKIDMSQYLIEDFDSLGYFEAGIFWKRSNLVFDALVVRVPSGYGKFEEIIVSITPEKWSKIKTISDSSTNTGAMRTGEYILNKAKIGSMIYLILGASHGRPDDLTDEQIREMLTKNREWGIRLSITEAFGTGDHVGLLVKKLFNITVYGPYSESLSGRPKIFVTDKLVEDHITPGPWGVLVN